MGRAEDGRHGKGEFPCDRLRTDVVQIQVRRTGDPAGANPNASQGPKESEELFPLVRREEEKALGDLAGLPAVTQDGVLECK